MYSLLLVDDESIILEGIYEVIKEAGMPLKEIQTASSALEALELYRNCLLYTSCCSTGGFLYRFGTGGLFLRLATACYSSSSNHLQM